MPSLPHCGCCLRQPESPPRSLFRSADSATLATLIARESSNHLCVAYQKCRGCVRATLWRLPCLPESPAITSAQCRRCHPCQTLEAVPKSQSVWQSLLRSSSKSADRATPATLLRLSRKATESDNHLCAAPLQECRKSHPCHTLAAAPYSQRVLQSPLRSPSGVTPLPHFGSCPV